MLDPGSGGGGQISNLISDDGKSPKGLLCHSHSVDILCECLCGWLSGIEMLSGAKLNFLSCHPPPFLPSLPSPISPSFFLHLSLSFPPPHVRNARSRFSSSSACLSFTVLSLSLCLYLVSLSLSMFRPVLFCTSELILDSLQPMLVSEKIMCI